MLIEKKTWTKNKLAASYYGSYGLQILNRAVFKEETPEKVLVWILQQSAARLKMTKSKSLEGVVNNASNKSWEMLSQTARPISDCATPLCQRTPYTIPCTHTNGPSCFKDDNVSSQLLYLNR